MKIEKCPFCDKAVAEITNCNDLEGCRHFEKCPATEPYVCVVCNMHEGGCGASSGYYDSEAKAIAAWNRRSDAVPVVRGEWLVTDAYPHRVYCSVCYKTNVPNEEWLFEKNEYPHFCMWCGTKMESEGGT